MQRRTFISAAIGSVAGMAGLSLPGTMARGTATASGVRPYQGAALAFGTTIAVTVLHHDQRQAELAIEDALHAPGISTAESFTVRQPSLQLNREAPGPDDVICWPCWRRRKPCRNGAMGV